jgi:hypothetical protein
MVMFVVYNANVRTNVFIDTAYPAKNGRSCLIRKVDVVLFVNAQKLRVGIGIPTTVIQPA